MYKNTDKSNYNSVDVTQKTPQIPQFRVDHKKTVYRPWRHYIRIKSDVYVIN